MYFRIITKRYHTRAVTKHVRSSSRLDRESRSREPVKDIQQAPLIIEKSRQIALLFLNMTRVGARKLCLHHMEELRRGIRQ